MSTLQKMMTRNLEMAIEDHKNRFTFKYDPNDPEDDDKSVYAFDVPNKSCPNNWHTFEGCHCANPVDYGTDGDNFGSETDVRSVYAFDAAQNGEVESVYAFDCEDDTSDEDEPMEANHPKRYTSAAQKSALLKQAEEARDRREHEDDKKAMVILATGCVAFISGWFLRFPWGWINLFLSGIVFVWGYLQSERDEECLRRDFDQTIERINSLIVRTAEVDDSEAVDTEDKAASVNDADDLSSDVEDVDEVVSVYAFDALHSDEAEEELRPESASPEAIPAKSTSSFGFSLPNLGEGLKQRRRAHTEDGYFEFWKSITYFQTKTDNYIYIVFKGQDIKTVVNKADIYTSFSEMPSEVAEMLVTVYIGIIDLE